MSIHETSSSVAPTKVHPASIIRFLWAGITAPILFAAVFLLDGALKPGYSADAEAISYLEVGQYGWVQQINFIVFGLLLIVFLIGYVRCFTPLFGKTWIMVGGTLLFLSDLGWILAGLFIPNVFLGPQFGWPAILHQIAFDAVFLPMTIAWLVLGVKLIVTPRWRIYGIYTFLIGLPLCAFSVIAIVNLVNPSSVAGVVGSTTQPAPHDGLTNRIVLLVAPLAWYLLSALLGLRYFARHRQ